MEQNLKDTIDYILKEDRISKEDKALLIEVFYEYNRDQLDTELREYLCEQYAGVILELSSAVIPIGGLGKTGAVVGEQLLKKQLGKKLSQEIGTGVASGAASGAIYGSGRGLIEDKNPLVTAAQDAVGGGIAGGALGAAGGAVEKAVRGHELEKFKDSNYIKEIGKKNVVKELKRYYSDYIQGIIKFRDDIGKYYYNGEGIRETIRQKFNKAVEIRELVDNVKKAEYIGPEELNHPRKNDLIKRFHRLRYKDTDYIFSEDKYGNIKFHIAKNADYNIKPKEPNEQNNSSGADISIPKPERLAPVLRGQSGSDNIVNNIITNNSSVVNSSVNNFNNNSYVQLSPTLLASGISKTEGHIFTREEIGAMSRKEFEANEAAIMEQMRNRQIHSAPKDYSGFINPQSGDDRIFTREDLKNMKREEYEANEAAIMAQLKSIGIPTNGELASAESRNGVIYVRPYTRDDGTEVSGYYRSLPRR